MSQDSSRALNSDDLERFTKQFASNPAYRLAQNAVTSTSLEDVALDRSVVTSIATSMSHHLDDWEVTNQKQSGRCWLFAGLNLLRAGAAKTMGVKDFEFSQNYLLFWDKLEKANFWLEAVIDTADRDVDDRTVAHLLANPAEDGGQWNMFVALVAKHGLVPKQAMPETHSSSKTSSLNRSIGQLLRRTARDIRAQAATGESPDHLRATKLEALEVAHRILAIHLGEPPSAVQWQWNDKDKGFHRDDEMSPQDFAARYAGLDLEDYVCIVHDPRSSSEVGHTYTVEYLGNVVDAAPVVYLNVEMSLLRELAMKALVDGVPVWFGCDTGKMANVERGYWDERLYDYDGVYDADLSMDKADRLLHHDTLMTHAMLFTGVDVMEPSAGRQVPRRWRVENSWGDEKADKGFWTMNDSWFGEHVFEIAVRRSALPV
ncbi:MAG: C1 family peptidase, partial [Actinomycetota bacterium]|nr:C1 family peptidase [Actinomycetota bacterium]